MDDANGVIQQQTHKTHHISKRNQKWRLTLAEISDAEPQSGLFIQYAIVQCNLGGANTLVD